MKTIVMKFGGTSVASNDKLKNIAEIVIKELNSHKIIVILSAMAGETNKLQSYLDEFGSKNSIESDLVLTSGEQVTIGLLSAALKNIGLKIPVRHIIINLAPADIKKEGSAYDLPIAVGVLLASNQIVFDDVERYLIMGELSLDGAIKSVKGILPLSLIHI